MAEASFGDSFTEDRIGLKVNASQLSLGKGTKTKSATAGAATLHQTSGVITSESVTTAAGATYTLTLANNKITASDIVMASVAYGTSSTGNPTVVRVQPSADQLIVTIQNIHASAAFNGTIKIAFMVVKI